jgi:hypothetical protein
MAELATIYLERAHTLEQVGERLDAIAKELAQEGAAIVSVSHTVGRAHPQGSYEFIVVGRPAAERGAPAGDLEPADTPG